MPKREQIQSESSACAVQNVNTEPLIYPSAILNTLLATGFDENDLVETMLNSGIPLRKIIESLGDLDSEQACRILESWLSPWKSRGEGNLDLSGIQWFQRLPVDMVVAGDLSLQGCLWVKELPWNLGVEGNLDLRGCANWEGYLGCPVEDALWDIYCKGKIILDGRTLNGKDYAQDYDND